MSKMFDDTGVPDVTAMMARMKLTSQLRGLKAQILALGKDPLSMIKSARLAEQLRKIRKELGAGAPVVSAAGNEPSSVAAKWAALQRVERVKVLVATGSGNAFAEQHSWKLFPDLPDVLQAKIQRFFEQEHSASSEPSEVATLRAVAAGQHDSKGLPELYGLIQEAVNGLDEAGELTGDAEAVANEAITHWAELEERLSAHV
jgi:hypothetical protein